MPRPPPSRVWVLFALTITIQILLHRSTASFSRPSALAEAGVLSRRSEPPVQTTFLFSLPYEQWSAALPDHLRPLLLPALLVILTFLFSFIGITASDFFCPNLSTIATYLGLNESTAGVTFLAFGNGSPDVFSTFAALKGGTFSLAVGELIGAATFSRSLFAQPGNR